MKSKVALLAGASGLIGQELLTLLLASPIYSKVVVLVRRPLDINHEKLEQKVVDFEKIDLDDLLIDHVFCTLGTTIKRAGSKAAFRQVDQQYVINVAKIAKQRGAELFTIVTAMGANSDSLLFYNQVKGDVEAELRQMAYKYLGIFRPSMLVGDRVEKRFAEQLGTFFMKAFNSLIPQNYKIIQVTKVATAMFHYATNPTKGVFVCSSAAMLKDKVTLKS
ncbi:NAD(P)H-binding protein [Colwellia piezophila]|uniref:NAD(P)H-binding protein n=1 Tax=Colwellia piezophila TaxID=211668 RepID=UPI0003690883|nr:NAD(P)H-binding protein [Colwellia piezophila]